MSQVRGFAPIGIMESGLMVKFVSMIKLKMDNNLLKTNFPVIPYPSQAFKPQKHSIFLFCPEKPGPPPRSGI